MSGEPSGAAAPTLRSLDDMFANRDGEPVKEAAVQAVAPDPAADPVEPLATETDTPHIEAEPSSEDPADATKPQPSRDEQGRFAKGDPQVALRQSRDEIATLKRRIADMEAKAVQSVAPAPQTAAVAPAPSTQAQPQPTQPPKMPDPLSDPDGFANWMDAQFRAREIDAAYRDALREHGNEKVEAAMRAAEEAVKNGGPSMAWLTQRIAGARDPFAEAMKWQSEQTAAAPNIEDLKAQLRAELEAEMASKKPASQPASVPAAMLPANMPTNLAALRSTGSGSGNTWAGPRSLDQIFGNRG